MSTQSSLNVLTETNTHLPVAVIGAGPVGLAAAAHLLERGIEPLVFEAGPTVGHSIRQWGHVRLFSPWRECLDPASVRLLEGTDWTAPDSEAVPTGDDIVHRYLARLAAVPTIARSLRVHNRVVGVGRAHLDKVRTADRAEAPFVLHVEDAMGRQHRHQARAVIDTSGTWSQPNPAGSGGLPALGEAQHAASIQYGIPDVLGAERARYANQRILVIGGGHSAANVLLDLARLQQSEPETTILWGIRRSSPERTYGGEDADALKGRGALGKRLHRLVDQGGVELLPAFNVMGFEKKGDALQVHAEQAGQDVFLSVDQVVACTGFRPDFSFLRELRLTLDTALESTQTLAPLIDPNIHSCGTVRPHGEQVLRHEEAGFYIAGMKSYGRAPTFLLLTGYEQVRSITAALAGDQDAADRVELCLPETGVCSATPALVALEDDFMALPLGDGDTSVASSGCCS